jgi:hypothetical protein
MIPILAQRAVAARLGPETDQAVGQGRRGSRDLPRQYAPPDDEDNRI